MDHAATSHQPNIVIAPLDWGLGHATRCIPIITNLIRLNCNVLAACEGKTKTLLQKEFPGVRFIDLKGYRIHYSNTGWALPLQMGLQIPKILSTIQYENQRLKEIVKDYAIHGIISDNRYGFYHEALPSVFITHQLSIRSSLGRMADATLQRLNYNYINKFAQCWVPDQEDSPGLAGRLSHPGKLPSLPVKYIGVLSRFEKNEPVLEKHLLILLSGPEPQRTVFEKILTAQLQHYKEPVVLVRGLPGDASGLKLPPSVTVFNHLPAEELNQKMNEASLVISRCGYSTVMDLAVLKKKSLLVPTPGQTEQQYLAKHLMQNNLALCVEQQKFRLKTAVELSTQFNYQLQHFTLESRLKATLADFIATIRQ